MTSRIGCPLCDGSVVRAFPVGKFQLSDCTACGHRFAVDAVTRDHVQTVYSDDYFFAGGDGYENYTRDGDLLRAQGERYGNILAKYTPVGRVLDVGSAAGFLQVGLEKVGWSSFGLEPNASMVDYAQNRLGLHARRGSLEEPPYSGTFDAICLIQVVGHFFDLRRALTSAARLTRPGGVCLVEYWRRDSWIARILGRRWPEYSPPSVIHWFTRPSLDAAMKAHGFHALAAGRPIKYLSGAHAASLLSHKLGALPGGRFLKVPTRLIPPNARIRYPSIDLEWRVYRRDEI